MNGLALPWNQEFPRRNTTSRFYMSGTEQFPGRGLKAALLQSRFILLAGFGGLLLLMAFAGVDSVVTLRQIQNSNDANREEFLWRTRLLEKIRSDVYLSGTYVRDYLLEPEAGQGGEPSRQPACSGAPTSMPRCRNTSGLLRQEEMRAVPGSDAGVERLLEGAGAGLPVERRRAARARIRLPARRGFSAAHGHAGHCRSDRRHQRSRS